MRSSSIAGAVALVLYGLCIPARAQRHTFHDYGQSDGLRNLNTRCFLQDTIGFLWVCTEDGLFRFDGSSFERMPMDSRDATYVTGITQDAAGRIWVAATHALLYYDSLGPHPVRGAGEPFEFDLHASLAAAPDDAGRIYFVSHHTLMVARWSPKDEWQVSPYFGGAVTAAHPQLKDITFVYAKPNGRLWLGCGPGVCFIANNVVRFYGTGDGLPEEQWRMAFLDLAGRLWVRGERHLCRLEAGAQKFTAADAGLPLSSIGVRDPAIIEDHQGRILINLTAGMARLEGNTWQILEEKSDLPPFAVTALFADRQGSVWLGLGGHGMARWLGYGGLTDRQGTSFETTRTLVCAYQMILPGEKAPSHRHSSHALRVIIDGKGSFSTVNGEKMPMETVNASILRLFTARVVAPTVWLMGSGRITTSRVPSSQKVYLLNH